MQPAIPFTRILIVEDYEPFRRAIYSLLQKGGLFEVIGEASDGAEGIQMAELLQPDLILLDIGLPKLNGIEVARQARKLTPRPRILFVSQEQSSDIAEECFRVGAQGYVQKTNVQNDLLSAIELVLDKDALNDAGCAFR